MRQRLPNYGRQRASANVVFGQYVLLLPESLAQHPQGRLTASTPTSLLACSNSEPKWGAGRAAEVFPPGCVPAGRDQAGDRGEPA